MEDNQNEQEQEKEEFNYEEELAYEKKQWFYKTIAVVVILGCIIGVASASLTYYFTLNRQNKKFVVSTYEVDDEEKTTASGAISDISDTLATFAEIIDSQYIGEINKKQLMDETVKGFVNGLGDQFSEYMTSEEWEEYQEDVLGNYEGVGIVMIADDNGYVLVSDVIKDSPAERAGIRQGDYIIGVNGESIYQEDSAEVSSKVKGEGGTEVTLNILRNESETLEFKLTRETIRMYHVDGEMLEGDIGYAAFSTFDSGCAAEFEKVVDELVSQGAKKLIIDLRYNTGGAVDEALKILDLFLEKGEIELITQSANGLRITTSSPTDKKYNFDNVVILINKYTASASEILTGALVDNGIAKTIGEKSFGKGIMQSVFKLLDGSVLKLTTQEYNTPNGTKINGVGITPDYEVSEDTTDENNEEIDVVLEKGKAVVRGEE